MRFIDYSTHAYFTGHPIDLTVHVIC